MLKLKTTFLALALAGAATMAAGVTASAQDKATVGIAMPTKSSARWIDDGNNMVKVLKERGYNTDLQYAEDDIPNQLSQVENMVTKGAKALVIAAIDGTTLSDVLKQAKAKGITVIAYDRLIRGTPNVDYYATFDNFQVGVLQAESIVQGLGLKDGKGPFNIELFGGSPDDNNAYFFYNGAMSVLKPYIDSGKLVVASGQMGMDKVATLRWDGATAQARMDNLLSAYYGNKKVNAVLSPYDGLSIGIISSLKGCRLWQRRPADACHFGPGCRGAIDQGDAARRPVFDHLQGHPRSRQGDRRHGRRRACRQAGHRQRHQDLRERRQDRAVLPAQAGRGLQGQLGEGPDRQRLLQEVTIPVRLVSFALAPLSRGEGGVRGHLPTGSDCYALRHCERSEAIQSSAAERVWIASLRSQ
ncbi:ABC-type xylose transport system substrate-binding protein [Bradyrhizobium sp. LB7.1]